MDDDRKVPIVDIIFSNLFFILVFVYASCFCLVRCALLLKRYICENASELEDATIDFAYSEDLPDEEASIDQVVVRREVGENGEIGEGEECALPSYKEATSRE